MDVNGNPERRIVVVGASGYVGGRLLARASREGPAIGTSSSGRGGLLPLALEAPERFDFDAFSARDMLVVTAAISSPERCSGDYEGSRAVNVTGTSVLVTEALSRGARVLFLASDTVYGATDGSVDETSPCSPVGVYGAMKFEVEQRFLGHSGFKSARLSYVFSKDDKFTRYLIACAESGRPAEVFHPFVRRVVYLGDVVEGLLAICRDWDRIDDPVVNFGGPELISRLDIASAIKRLAYPELKIEVIEPAPDFFRERPRVIDMVSERLPRILQRPTLSLEASIHQELCCGGK